MLRRASPLVPFLIFNTAMVDAAAMAILLGRNVGPPTSVIDDPSSGTIECRLEMTTGSVSRRFTVEVNDDEVFVSAISIAPTFNSILQSSDRGGLSVGELHACRAQVLQSFVWNQYCAPELP